MKKIIPALISASLLALPVVALAQTAPPDTWTGPGDIITLIDSVTNWIFAIFLAAAVLFIIFAALQFLTSGGDATRVSNARNSLLYALIGIAVAFLAKGFIVLVKVILNVP